MSVVATIAKPKTSAAFPAAEVEARLRDELIAAAKVEADLHGTPWPREAAAQRAVSIRVDSLVVVGILCAVEPTLEFELPESVVHAGGYRSVDQAIGHLMPRIEQEWRKRKGGGDERRSGERGS